MSPLQWAQGNDILSRFKLDSSGLAVTWSSEWGTWLLLMEAVSSCCWRAERNPRSVLQSDLCSDLEGRGVSNGWQSLVILLPLRGNSVFTVLREADVDCLTLGQYMQPTKRHLKVKTPLIYRQRYGLYLAQSSFLFLNGGLICILTLTADVGKHFLPCLTWSESVTDSSLKMTSAI